MKPLEIDLSLGVVLTLLLANHAPAAAGKHPDAPLPGGRARQAQKSGSRPALPSPLAPALAAVAPPHADTTDAPTGLIIDARDLEVQKAMGPRLLDEDGTLLYPDPKHLPDFESLQDDGLASYPETPEKADRRAGPRPLVVRAVAVTGPGRDDLIVTRQTAQQIRQAEARGGFLRRWAVSILVRPKSAP